MSAPTPPDDGEPTLSASDALSAALGRAAQRAGLDPARDSGTAHVVWAAMGGRRGVLESVLPTLVFIVVWTATVDPATHTGALWPAVALSVGLAAVFTIVRLVTRSPAAPAIGGLVATAAAAALALWTGRAADNFIIGLATDGVYGVALLISALVRWPLVGVVAGWLMNQGTSWRDDARARRVFFWLTIAWVGLFAIRLAVEVPLFLAGDVTVLGILKIALGLPLFAPMVAVTWLAVRGLSTHRHPPAEPSSEAPRG